MSEIRLIDANALKESFSGYTLFTANTVIEHIDNAPTVTNGTYEQGFRVGAYGRLDEIRPQGDLIKMSDRFGVYFACNKCGYDRMKSDNMNFCPNCGVDFQKGGAE